MLVVVVDMGSISAYLHRRVVRVLCEKAVEVDWLVLRLPDEVFPTRWIRADSRRADEVQLVK
jgi:hypothetical protein